MFNKFSSENKDQL